MISRSRKAKTNAILNVTLTVILILILILVLILTLNTDTNAAGFLHTPSQDAQALKFTFESLLPMVQALPRRHE